LWVSPGDDFKVGRWFSTPKKMLAFMPYLGYVFLALLIMGLLEQFYTCIDELQTVSSYVLAKCKTIAALPSSSASSSSSTAPLPLHLAGIGSSVPVVAGSALPSKETVRSNEYIEEELKKHKVKKTLRTGLRILALGTTRRIWVVMAEVPKPVADAHSVLIATLHARLKTRDWLVEMAGGKYNDYLAKVVGVLQDDRVLFSTGLRQDPSHADTSNVRKEEDIVVMKAMVDLVRSQFTAELSHMRFYSDRPPYKFLMCLSSDANALPNLLRWAKDLYAGLRALEGRAVVDPWFRDYLRDTLWAESIYDLEFLIGLDEADFEMIPRDLKLACEDLAESFNASLIAEEGFKELDKFEHSHRAGFLGRTSRWHRLTTCGVLENFGRKQPPVTAAAKACRAAKVDPKIYEAARGPKAFSLGEEVFDRFENAKVMRPIIPRRWFIDRLFIYVGLVLECDLSQYIQS
jgi:hypothetical protein